ncbi:PepSY domain-containing protein [Thalassotalea crassostreae]|uniref:PepSY domain-containing protein n=1 Tax=Thalassotalea crassostreae TaxID=1763536 RepID=UPI000838A994|nr:PepSY domain-containing protein [Thalassotalea crassostreae]
MNKKTIIKIHLYTAAFLLPIILMISISGGLYLFGFKGTTENTPIDIQSGYQFDRNSNDLDAEVKKLLSTHGFNSDFEYLKQGGNNIYTRPTSKQSFVVTATESSLKLTKVEPDFIKTLVELHKGHGPTAFKTLQKFTAFGLVLILISGLIAALMNKRNRKVVGVTMSAGFLIFLFFAI